MSGTFHSDRGWRGALSTTAGAFRGAPGFGTHAVLVLLGALALCLAGFAGPVSAFEPEGAGQTGRRDVSQEHGAGGVDQVPVGAASPASCQTKESPVAGALRWLAAHQLPDGGWHFDLEQAPDCRGKCRNSATNFAEARNAATALALLPFLGFGEAHLESKYQATVKKGLEFLVGRMKDGPDGGRSLAEPRGTMYSHGMASIALCEAYAMTRDKALHKPAQAAIDFTIYAQDPAGGGWRYQPRQPGDTSILGWQIMALKSGLMADLRVAPEMAKRADQFLDSVQENDGANYGYIKPGSGEATTAIGLLARMHLGWKKDHPALQRGVAWLSEKGPSETNMYYNYFASQVIWLWQGEEWMKWNRVMLDHLDKTQAKEGHEAGSWSFKTSWGDHAGRLYDTAMATMILELYYRHLPIYCHASIETAFPR